MIPSDWMYKTYYCCCCLELEDSKSEKCLKQITDNGSHNRDLNEEDLISLMKKTFSPDGRVKFYEILNKEFLEKIKNVPILELIKVDCRGHPSEFQTTSFYAGTHNTVTEIVHESNKNSSPQVNFISFN